MDRMLKCRNRRPDFFTKIVTQNLTRLAAQHPGSSSNPAASARAYVAFSIPFGYHRVLGSLGWGLATAWDELSDGNVESALATLSLLLVAIEQAALDDGSWSLAWLLTLLPEPPWATMNRRPDTNALRPFSRLADTQWIAAAISYIRDVEKIRESRARPSGTASSSGAQAGKTETPAQAKTKGTPKGGGKGKEKIGKEGEGGASAPGNAKEG